MSQLNFGARGRCVQRGLAAPHPVDETLHEPLGAVNPRRHLLSVL